MIEYGEDPEIMPAGHYLFYEGVVWYKPEAYEVLPVRWRSVGGKNKRGNLSGEILTNHLNWMKQQGYSILYYD